MWGLCGVCGLCRLSRLWKTDVRTAPDPYRFAMRSTPAILAALVTLVALTGCQPDATPIIPDPVPSSDLLFESEEEALAAAEEAYGAYQDVESLIFVDGGQEPERISPYATGDALELALAGFENFRESGYRAVGASEYALTALQQYSAERGDGKDVVGAYLCLDVEPVDVLDADGNSVVSSTRPGLQSFEVSFDLVEDRLLLSRLEPWTGGDVCESQ